MGVICTNLANYGAPPCRSPSGRILSGNSRLLNRMPAQQIRPAMPTWPQVLAAYPLVICYSSLWKITILNGKIHYFYGTFSIAFCMFTRGYPNFRCQVSSRWVPQFCHRTRFHRLCRPGWVHLSLLQNAWLLRVPVHPGGRYSIGQAREAQN